MHLFWASHFILPKSVARDIEQILRRFLWSGPDLSKVGAKIRWVDVAVPKEEAGLGIKRVEVWNQALICKLFWKIISPSDQSLWARWIKGELIKDRSVWHIPIPQSASWSWRKSLGLRTKIRSLVRYVIGDGKDTWLWFDPWLPGGPIWDRWGDRIIYDSGIPSTARVDAIIQDGAWRWPVASSPALMDLKSIPLPSLPIRGEKDHVIWCPSRSGSFSTSSAWEEFRPHLHRVPWHHLIWDSPSIPKASFFAWVAVKAKLSTQDRLFRWGCINHIRCWLCDGDREDHDHLFLSCSYSRRIWTMGLGKLEMSCRVSSFVELLTLCIVSFAGRSFKAKIGRLFFNTTIYWLWRERNNRAHGKGKRDEHQLMRMILEWTRGAMFRATDGPTSSQDHFFARRWGFSDRG